MFPGDLKRWGGSDGSIGKLLSRRQSPVSEGWIMSEKEESDGWRRSDGEREKRRSGGAWEDGHDPVH